MYSLTESFIVNPISALRAPMPVVEGNGAAPHLGEVIYRGIQAEGVSRIVALATSIFAMLDTITHFVAGLSEGVVFLARYSCCLPTLHHGRTAHEHMQQAANFALLTAVGSIAGVIWPGIFQVFQRPQTIEPTGVSHPEARSATITADSNPTAILPELDGIGASSSELTMESTAERTSALVGEAFGRDADYVSKVGGCEFFYHATNVTGLREILESGQILGPRAWVSTRPEARLFGRYVLVLKRKEIDRHEIAYNEIRNLGRPPVAWWVSFINDIPVRADTLDHIQAYERGGPPDGRHHDGTERPPIEELTRDCAIWAGREVRVVYCDIDSIPSTRLPNQT